jgi:hypothetical protein
MKEIYIHTHTHTRIVRWKERGKDKVEKAGRK